MLKMILSLHLVLIALGSNGTWADGNSAIFSEGKGYELVKPSQPTHNSDKIEVIEFFWYGCPHCYRFEPYINKWLQQIPENVEFIRQPAIFGPRWSMHAKAYFTAEALDVVEKVHADLFDAIQNKNQKLQSESELAEFFAKYGIARAEFDQAFNSFIVDTKMRQASSMGPRYGLSGVPVIIINGKYRTGGSIAKNFGEVINVMDFLIAKEGAPQ